MADFKYEIIEHMKTMNSRILIISLAVAFALISACAASTATVCAGTNGTDGTVQVSTEGQGPFGELEGEFMEASGLTTEMQDSSGNKYRHEGVLDASRLEEYECVEKLASYRLLKGEECLAEIVLNDISCEGDDKSSGAGASENRFKALSTPRNQNGYYSIDFTLSAEDNTEMFLTGLSYDHIASVEEEIISSITSDKNFDITRLNFIDAEKQFIGETSDSNLCWAASLSNILQYTGWASYLDLRNSKGDIMDCDDILELFAANFYDKGYNTICGLGYILNGVDGWSDYVHGYEKEAGYGPKPDAARTIYDKKHAYDMVTLDNSFNEQKDHTGLMQDQFEKLRNGWGITIGLGWLNADKTGYFGAHAVSLWGYIIDKDYDEADKNRYTALVVSDSDNSPAGKNDRRTAPNKLTVTWIQPFEGTADSWKEVYSRGVLISMQNLMPYSDSIPVETDPEATCNKVTTCDFVVSEIDYSEGAEGASVTGSMFTDNQDIHVSPAVSNLSEQDVSAPLKYKATVCNSKGEKVCEKTKDIDEISIKKHGCTKIQDFLQLGKLSPGTYTLTIDINSDRSISEAFYYNNANCSSTFTVVADPARNVSLTAKSDDYGETYGNVEFSYEDPDSHLKKAGNTYSMESSYMIDGTWTAWAAAGTLNEEGKLQDLTNLTEAPANAAVDKSGTKARFRLIIRDGNVKSTVYGNEIDLEYNRLSALTRGINTDIYTPLKNGSCSLRDGEVLACRISNASTKKGVLKCRAEIGLMINGEFEAICRKDGIKLDKGEESEIISVSQWSKSRALYNSTEAYVRMYYESGGKEICQKAFLGEIKVRENPSTTVTTSGDIENMYDGAISLREAVKYSRQLGKPGIHISSSLEEQKLTLTSPLEITSEIRIHGLAKDTSGNLTGQDSETSTTINAEFESSGYMFKTGESGKLSLDHVRIVGKSNYKVSLGITENAGGQVCLCNCLITGVSGMGLNEALFHADGGSISLQNTSVISIVAGNEIFAADNSGRISMLNCLLCDNTGTDAVINNKDGDVSIAYSTFLSNTIYKSAGSACDAACIRSGQETDTSAIGCIILHADETWSKSIDLSGPMKAFGCIYGSADSEVAADALCRKGDFADAFEIDESSGKPEFETDRTGSAFWQKLPIPLEELQGQLYIKADDGVISYSSADRKWIRTGVKALFESKCYKRDILGNTHNGYPGCYSPAGTTPAQAPDPSEPDPPAPQEKTDIGTCEIILSGHEFDFADKVITPEVTVEGPRDVLKEGTDYKADIPASRKVGTYNVTVTGIGNYEGTISDSYIINPPAKSIKTVKAGRHKLTIKWKKSSNAYLAETDEYQIRYSTSRSFRTYKTRRASSKSTTITIRKLKTHKKYYMQMRTCKTVNGEKYYSAWSKTKAKKL